MQTKQRQTASTRTASSLNSSERPKNTGTLQCHKRKNYPPNTKVKIVTLSDVLYMEQLNDISFVIDGKLVVLIEHQSSINENMPLRMLMCIAREYELLTNGRDL